MQCTYLTSNILHVYCYSTKKFNKTATDTLQYVNTAVMLPAYSVSSAWHPTAAAEHQVPSFQTPAYHAACEITQDMEMTHYILIYTTS